MSDRRRASEILRIDRKGEISLKSILQQDLIQQECLLSEKLSSHKVAVNSDSDDEQFEKLESLSYAYFKEIENIKEKYVDGPEKEQMLSKLKKEYEISKASLNMNS